MMRPTRGARTAALALAGAGAGAVAVATVATLGAFRASGRERRRALPGDVVVRSPMYVTTQAVTIAAPPERVWPWLAQMGAGRAGWYSYDRVDNGGRPSAGEILPQYQEVATGDVFPAIPGATDAFVVAAVSPPSDLVLAVPGADGSRVSWEFFLEPLGHDHTRLVVRGRVARDWLARARRPAAGGPPITIERVYALLSRLPRPLLQIAAGFGHRVMQNQQLRGISRRATAERPA